MAALAPHAVWVVFPSAYLNSPASMFGHTLLRLDGDETQAGTPLLAYAVNYAAATTEHNGLVFAVRGLTGGYRGQFSVLPYYEKVKEYARLESRDLWEYPLALSDDEKHMLLLHLWELRGAEFRYYFFTRNCSYELLTLLRVARPQLQWGHRYDWRAIPTDTLRTLSPFLGAPHFRPSLATQLVDQAAQLDANERHVALALADGRRAADDPALMAMPRDAQARTLTHANDLLYYGFLSGERSREAALPRSQQLLRARAALATDAGFAPTPPPTDDPLQAHDTQRLALGAAFGSDTRALSLGWRPAYHDLLDAPAGYGPGQQISFLDIAARLDLRDGHLHPATENLIDIVSVSPRTPLFRPISWRVRLAGEPSRLDGGAFGGVLEGGPGLSFGRFDALVGYAFLQTRADVNADLPRGWGLGAGPLIGVLANPLAGWQVQAEAERLQAIGDAGGSRTMLRFGQQWSLSRDLALRSELRYERWGGSDRLRADLSVQHYF
nr:DUF4105 domain-containing protein [Solimonas marina]